jgi:predicted phosphoadenosine phosphosulfate sulfurtransferase
MEFNNDSLESDNEDDESEYDYNDNWIEKIRNNSLNNLLGKDTYYICINKGIENSIIEHHDEFFNWNPEPQIFGKFKDDKQINKETIFTIEMLETQFENINLDNEVALKLGLQIQPIQNLINIAKDYQLTRPLEINEFLSKQVSIPNICSYI